MIRTITFTVDNNLHVSPSSPQEAGVQGDDGATKVYFVLPSDDKLSGFRSYDFYLEMVDAAGNYDISDKLTVGTDGKVGYALPAAWTQCGGLIQLRLVAKSGSEIAYTFAGQITVAKRAAAKLTLLPKFKEMVLTTIEKCKEAIASAKAAAQSATESFKYCEQARLSASSAGASAQEAAQSEELAEARAGDSYTAANAASVSASAASDSEAAAAVSKQDAEVAATAAAASAAAANTALSEAENAAKAAGESAVAAEQSTTAAGQSAAAASEDAASAVSSATAAEQSATAAGQSAAAAAASAAGAAQSAAALENVGALTLIDSVTLTEAVQSYVKTLPAGRYRELYIAATVKVGGTVSNGNADFYIRETTGGYQVAMATGKFSAGGNAYVCGRMFGLKGRGIGGMVSCGTSDWYDGYAVFKPGARDAADATGYIEGCCLFIAPPDSGVTACMDVGTKIQIWGR